MTQSNTQEPINFKTRKAYFGTNLDILNEAAQQKGFSSNEWGTMKQWNSANEVVEKGQKSTRIEFTDKKGEEVIAFLFNQCQLA